MYCVIKNKLYLLVYNIYIEYGWWKICFRSFINVLLVGYIIEVLVICLKIYWFIINRILNISISFIRWILEDWI